MRRVKNLSTALFMLLFCTGAFAQQKYGHINSDEILNAMPEFKQMNKTLESKRMQYASQLQRMYEDYEKKGTELQQYGQSMMQAIAEERKYELDSLQMAIMNFEGSAQEEVQKLQQKLLKPLNDKYLKVVNAVAKENGYTFIFDLSSNIVAYYPEDSGDITNLVKQKMGIN